ncbi:MAG: sulfurtransferase TusA family protein [Actinomycetota bacterium]|jgi:tRNA 2-thiouridine synthesizing protein A|nr:sulfurtransferase TusA family protein [Actinomycetota bacterium]MDA8167811.1 sulfurtransferase TusA family protein [Actinomycetota bacterium]
MQFNKNDDGTYELDVTGYVCPHPQLYTLKCMEKLQDGMIMDVLIDNPSSVESVTQACTGKGYEILEKTNPKAGVTALKIQK